MSMTEWRRRAPRATTTLALAVTWLALFARAVPRAAAQGESAIPSEQSAASFAAVRGEDVVGAGDPGVGSAIENTNEWGQAGESIDDEGESSSSSVGLSAAPALDPAESEVLEARLKDTEAEIKRVTQELQSRGLDAKKLIAADKTRRPLPKPRASDDDNDRDSGLRRHRGVKLPPQPRPRPRPKPPPRAASAPAPHPRAGQQAGDHSHSHTHTHEHINT